MSETAQSIEKPFICDGGDQVTDRFRKRLLEIAEERKPDLFEMIDTIDLIAWEIETGLRARVSANLDIDFQPRGTRRVLVLNNLQNFLLRIYEHQDAVGEVLRATAAKRRSKT